MSARRTRLARFALAVALALTAPVLAQTDVDPEEFWAPMFRPWIDREALERALAEAGQPAAESAPLLRQRHDDLIEAYRRHFEHFVKLQASIREATARWEAEPGGRDAWLATGRDFGNVMVQLNWMIDQHELEREFAEDVLAVLDPAAHPVWQNALGTARRQRVLDRLRELRRGRTIPDLVAVADGLELPAAEAAAIEERVRGYADELDARLAEWERHERETGPAWRRVLGFGCERKPLLKIAEPPDLTRAPREAWDLEASERIMQAGLDRVEAIRDHTMRSVHLIAEVMSDEAARGFRAAVERIVYPQVYTASPVDLLVPMLRENDRLDDDARAAIERAYGEYERDRALVRRGMIEALDRWEHPTAAEIERRRALFEREREIDGDFDILAKQHPVIEHVRALRALTVLATRRLRDILGDRELSPAARMLLSWTNEE